MSDARADEPAARSAADSTRRDFDLFRLRLGHVVAFLAALALIFIMAGDWYTTDEGVRAREIERGAEQGVPGWGMIDRGAVEDAKLEAEKAERNAWQTASFLDVLVVIGLLATVALAIAAAALQAAGRTFDPKRSPSALAGGAAIAAFVVVAAQAIARLDLESAYVFQVGLPLGVMALGAIALGSAMAVRDALTEGEHAGSPPRAGSERTAPAAPAPAGAGPEGGGAAGAEGARGATYNRAS